MADSIFKYDGIQDASAIAPYIEAIRDGFAKGGLCLTQGGQEIILTPQGLVTITVEGKRKGDDCKFKLTMRWKERGADEDAGAPLHIQAQEPENA